MNTQPVVFVYDFYQHYQVHQADLQQPNTIENERQNLFFVLYLDRIVLINESICVLWKIYIASICY